MAVRGSGGSRDRSAAARGAKRTEKPGSARRAKQPKTTEEGARFGRRNLLLLAVALAVIVIGFVSLAMGSMVLAPILLVGGYLVGVPYALMAREKAEEGS